MKKEILELMMLGLQAKNVLTIENLSNALTNLTEKQQLQWIETMLQDENELSSDAETFVLKVTQGECVPKLELIVYVKRLLDCPLKEAKDLIFNNNVFKLTVSRCDIERVIKELRDNMRCIVEIT